VVGALSVGQPEAIEKLLKQQIAVHAPLSDAVTL
jgi:hypothetical protein